eukprot:m.462163 g.462163  ORF g.462163 m.462163 type:complete len:227 (+) comp22534_c0_seq1:67-747(+)
MLGAALRFPASTRQWLTATHSRSTGQARVLCVWQAMAGGGAKVVPSFDPDETFDVCDTENNVIGQAPRAKVHAEGLWHRSVQTIVLNRHGQMLMQRRSPSKDVAPGCWDLSCSEHLQPSETYLAGAVRGLQEELGISCDPTDLTQIVDTFQQNFDYQELGKFDREFVQCFLLENYDGPVQVDAVEVVDSKWLPSKEVIEFATSGGTGAPWFLDTMERIRATVPEKF